MRDFFDRTKVYWTREWVKRKEDEEGKLEPATDKVPKQNNASRLPPTVLLHDHRPRNDFVICICGKRSGGRTQMPLGNSTLLVSVGNMCMVGVWSP